MFDIHARIAAVESMTQMVHSMLGMLDAQMKTPALGRRQLPPHSFQADLGFPDSVAGSTLMSEQQVTQFGRQSLHSCQRWLRLFQTPNDQVEQSGHHVPLALVDPPHDIHHYLDWPLDLLVRRMLWGGGGTYMHIHIYISIYIYIKIHT